MAKGSAIGSLHFFLAVGGVLVLIEWEYEVGFCFSTEIG
jgi:hypothetical protein